MQEQLLDVDSEALAKECVEICEGRKAENVILYDMRGRSILADYYLICTGTSEPHIHAIEAHIDKELSAQGIEPRSREGQAVSRWTIMDYGNIIIHILDPDRREFYQLEDLWDDGRVIHRSSEDF